MTLRGPEQLERIREVLDQAMERPTSEREDFIARACAGDTALHSEATSLLRALGRAGHLLDPAGTEAGFGAAPAAPDLTGLTVGPYRVTRRIGAGGMGVVYAAEDTRLGRTVAIKSMPSDVVADPLRRAMLEHEARLLAAVNHPNIASIYGIEQSSAYPLLVLEYVEGPTLAELLQKGPIPVDETRAIATQVLLALEAAHAAGIVHRDIKPSNIKLTPAGVVKVLDFGIAKAPAAGLGTGSGNRSPVAPTQSGRIVGTPAYMSPEQARGKPVDRRTDIWAFGCVLYQMLAGRPAFEGDTASDCVAAVLRAEPDWSLLPARTSPGAIRLLRRCLAKDPEQRLRDAGDVRLELEDTFSAPAASADSAVERPTRRLAMAATALFFLLTGAVAGTLLWRPSITSPSDTPVTRFHIDLTDDLSLFADTIGGCIALSPDGRSLVYTASAAGGENRLFLQRMDSINAVPLPGTANALTPCFSPDGQSIAFYEPSSKELRRIRVEDASPATIAVVESSGYGIAWGPDGDIFYEGFNGKRGGIQRIASSGGVPTELTVLDDARNELSHTQPEALPDGSAVLFTCARTVSDQYRLSIEAVRIRSGERRVVVSDACQPHYLSSGHLIYFQGGSLMAAAFDPRTLTILGEPRRVLERIAGAELIPRPRYTVSRTGTFAYLPSPTTYECRDLAWFSPSGGVTSIYQAAGVIASLRLSPDGRYVAFAANSPATPDIWVLDMAKATATRLTNDGGHWSYPVWTPDGKRVAFSSMSNDGRSRVDWAPADGTSPPQLFAQLPLGAKADPCSFSPDGKALFVSLEQGPGVLTDLFKINVEGDRAPHPVFGGTNLAYRPGGRLSPDGSLLAYSSQETGRLEVYLQTYPALDKKVRVSVSGGLRPTWSADGTRLFFQYQDKLFEATVSQQPELTASAPRQLLAALPDSRYDASPDGSRFIMGVPPGGSAPQVRIEVIDGWGSLVKRAISGPSIGR